MDRNRITIGRASSCDVHINEQWDTVSNEHADIERQGDSLVFYDHSSNGTVINGQRIRNTNVRIYPGDKILLAGVFELGWDVINRYFPSTRRPTVTQNIHEETGRKTVRFAPGDLNGQRSGRQTEQFDRRPANNYHISVWNTPPAQRNDMYGQANAYSQADIDKALEKWNWGAFFCTWLWAVCHKIYWPLLILIVGLVPYIGQVCSLCLCVYLGFNGSRMAWESGRYKDFESYVKAQRNWAFGGLVWFVLSASISALVVYSTLNIL